MTRHLSLSLVTVVIAAGLTGLPLTAAFAAEATKTAMTDIEAARTALSKGNTQTAVERTERAETGLLNAKQAGEDVSQKALDDMKQAREALDKKDRTDAKAALDKAATDLRT